MIASPHAASLDAPVVLVVDDDPATLVLLRKVLAQAGFAVDVAGGGAEAMTLALTRKYDAVLLDLVMPPPDGFAVLRQIAAVAPRLLPKVIVITSYPQRVHAANTYALLNKPLDLREVVRLTRECTEKQA